MAKETMEPLDLKHLEAVRAAATQGEWFTEKPTKTEGGFSTGMIVAAVARGQCIYVCPPGGIAPEANRRHIATFDPPMMDRILRGVGKELKVYTCNEFEGLCPVGSAAVIVAKDKRQAISLLEKRLEKIGLQQDVPAKSLKLLDQNGHGVIILCDGNY